MAYTLTAITAQPGAGSINAAYRPIIFMVKAAAEAPLPVVSCDIYLFGVIYRTLTATAVDSVVGYNKYWKFDIQDVLQDFLGFGFPDTVGEGVKYRLIDAMQFYNSQPQEDSGYAAVSCKFSSFVINNEGFIESQSEELASYKFYVYNATLQQQSNMDLLAHIKKFNTLNPNAYYVGQPLSHRRDGYIVGQYDYDFYPFLITDIEPSSDPEFRITIEVFQNNDLQSPQDIGQSPVLDAFLYVNNLPMYLVSGLAQLRNISWNDYTSPLDPLAIFDPGYWKHITHYRVGLINSNMQGEWLIKTPIIKIDSCSNTNERIRIRFLNYLGQWDYINFYNKQEVLDTESTRWQKGLSTKFNISERGNIRFGTSSGERYVAETTAYGEEHQNWLKELFATPQAYVETYLEETNVVGYLPIIIKDGSFTTRKNEDRYEYQVILEFELANKNIHQRT